VATNSDKDSVMPWQVLRNTASNFIGQFITLGAGFLLTPFILSQLGPSSYGLWVLVGSIAAYGFLFDLGITSAVVKYTAEYQARDDIEQMSSLIATTLWFYLLIGLLLIVLGALFAPIFPQIFNVAEGEEEIASWLVLITSVSMAMSLISTIPTSVLSGLQRFDLINILTTSGTLFVAIATIITLLMGGGVLGMVAVTIPLTLLMQIPSIWLVKRVEPGLRYGLRGADRTLARTLFSYSSAIFVSKISGNLQNKTDEIVIGAFLPITAITPYSLARRLSEISQILTNQFMRVILPLASELDAGNDQGRLRALYLTSTRLTLAIFFPFGAIMTILAPNILTVWVGEEYVPYGYLVFILTIARFVDIIGWPGGAVLQGMARHRPLAYMSLGAAILNLAISIVLAPRLGLFGVALGTLIPTIIVILGFIQPYILRTISIGLLELLRTVFVPICLPAIPMLAFLYVMDQMLALTSLLPLLLTAGISFVVYALGYLAWGASEYERQVYRGFARQTFKVAKVHLNL
jgi:O-antigen/teichoic acid export membrane protein